MPAASLLLNLLKNRHRTALRGRFTVYREYVMAFAVSHLSVLAYANGFTLWHYKADGNRQADVSAPSFFQKAAGMLASGDMVMVSAEDGGRLLCIAVSGGAVTAVPLA
jgi:hypothetical protein